MSDPVNMNQVIFQTPNVEKIQLTEQQNPDQMQRFAAAQEMANFKARTETVQESVKPEDSNVLENEKRNKEKQRRKKKTAQKTDPEEKNKKTTRPRKGAGTIVDVII
jgi:hypothetical protein